MSGSVPRPSEVLPMQLQYSNSWKFEYMDRSDASCFMMASEAWDVTMY